MKLTNNFSKHEFDCNDGSEMPSNVFYNVAKLAIQLQTLRNHINKSITVNSGYRSPYYNDVVLPSKGIKTSKNSQHKLGKAADIKVKGLSSSIVYGIIEDLISKGEMLQGGLGLYNGFVHYDIRNSNARWDFRKKL